MVQQRTPAVRKANKETANAAAKVAAAAAAAAVTTTAAATAAAVPLGRSPGGDALIDSRMFARNVTVRARAPWAENVVRLDSCHTRAWRFLGTENHVQRATRRDMSGGRGACC